MGLIKKGGEIIMSKNVKKNYFIGILKMHKVKVKLNIGNFIFLKSIQTEL